MTQPSPLPSRWRKRMFYIVAFLLFYILTVMPVGLFLYTFKSEKNIDMFEKTGFHAYLACLDRESRKIQAVDDLLGVSPTASVTQR
jgi:hypothetical protein